MLSTIYENYETALDSYLDNAVKVIADSIDTVNAGTSEINETIKDKAEGVGLELSDKMDSVWNDEDKTLQDGFNGVSENINAENGVLSEIKLENKEIADLQRAEIASEVQKLLDQDNVSNQIASSINGNTDSIINIINAMAESLNKLVANSEQIPAGSSISGSAITATGLNNDVIYSPSGVAYKPIQQVGNTALALGNGLSSANHSAVQAIIKDAVTVSQPIIEKPNNTGNTIETVEVNTNINVEAKDYQDFVKQLQSDKKFEKVIVDITSSALTGSSSLAKYRHQIK